MIYLSFVVMTICAACWAGSIYLILVRRFKNKAALRRYNRIVLALMVVNLLVCLPLLLWLKTANIGVHFLLTIATVTDVLSTGGLGVFCLYSRLCSYRSLPTNADMIVILGAATHHGQVPPVLAARLKKGIECWQEHCAAKIIVTGGVVHNETTSEAATMANYLDHAGIPREQIIQEKTAKNTWQNLMRSAALIPKGKNVMVVTSDFHVFRVTTYLKRLALPWRVYGAKTPLDHCPLTFVRDYLGIIRDHRWLAALILILAIIIAL